MAAFYFEFQTSRYLIILTFNLADDKRHAIMRCIDCVSAVRKQQA